MATVLSMINLKGGVGKTTTTVAVAEILAAEHQKNVLVIDLDPQTNATVMLIGEEKWNKLNDAGRTLAQLFKDALDPENRRFDLRKSIQKDASPVEAVRTLSLLPSSIDLIEVQDRLYSMPAGRYYTDKPVDILRKAVRPALDEFDIVLIDCPPNLGIITLNGLRMSNGYIIPTVPDILSTYGIPQIVRRVSEFSDAIGEPIEPLGIVVTKYQANSSVHANTLRALRGEKDAPLFSTMIPQSNQMSAAAEPEPRSTLRQRWGYQGGYAAYEELAAEIVQRIAVPA